MKKLFSILGLGMMVVAAFLLSSLLEGNALKAQTLNTTSPTAQRNWMDKQEALLAISAEMSLLKSQILNPNPPVKQSLLKARYLVLEYVNEDVVADKPTQVAVFNGYDKARNELGLDSTAPDVTQPELDEILVLVIDLLDK
jgi:hypothetical protein